jgi:hypothetical protein
MQIKNAYAVTVDFDGDIKSDASGFRIFAGEDARKEVRGLVRQALADMNSHEREKGRAPMDDAEVSDRYLDEFIDVGGDYFGNWEITIQCTEE